MESQGGMVEGGQQDAAAEVEDDVDDECSICFAAWDNGEEEEGSKIAMLRCGHGFHARCVDAWLEICARKSIQPTCPFFRGPIARAE